MNLPAQCDGIVYCAIKADDLESGKLPLHIGNQERLAHEKLSQAEILF